MSAFPPPALTRAVHGCFTGASSAARPMYAAHRARPRGSIPTAPALALGKRITGLMGRTNKE